MKEFSFIIDRYLKGESIYKPIRVVLNLLFNITISSFFYEKYVGSYYWFNYNDYKAILDFFVKGHYIVPLCIFMLVYFSLEIITSIIFSLLTTNKSIELQNKITSISLQSEKAEIENKLKENQYVNESIKEIISTPDWAIKYYQILQRSISKSDLKKLESLVNKLTIEIQSLFKLIFRILILFLIYHFVLPDFGFWLWLIVSIMLLVIQYLLVKSFIILSVAPLAIKTIAYQMEQLINIETSAS